jgi:hypothetical protein
MMKGKGKRLHDLQPNFSFPAGARNTAIHSSRKTEPAGTNEN